MPGSDFIGGDPASVLTAITFSRTDVGGLIAHHTGDAVSCRRKRSAAKPAAVVEQPDDDADGDRADALVKWRKADLSAIPPGALLATMAPAESALGVSRGTIYNLLDRGKLVRKHTGLRSVSIEATSIRAFAGKD